MSDENKRWSLKNMRWVTNKNYGNKSAWIANTLSFKEDPFIGIKYGASSNLLSDISSMDSNQIKIARICLEMAFNNEMPPMFHTMNDDKFNAVNMDNYFTLSQYAKQCKFRINLRKGRLENVKDKTNRNE